MTNMKKNDGQQCPRFLYILWLTISGSFMYIILYKQFNCNVAKGDGGANNRIISHPFDATNVIITNENISTKKIQQSFTKAPIFLSVENLTWILTVNGQPCTRPGASETLLILIHSARSHFHQRNSIRKSWGSLNIYRNWSIVLVFLLGMGKNNSSSEVNEQNIDNQLLEEHTIHNDLVIGNFIDVYENLTYKSIMGLKWALNFCPEANLVLKTDDNMYFDLMEFIDIRSDELDRNTTPNTDIFCHNVVITRPARNETKHWSVTLEEWGDQTYYPPYCTGLAYALGMDTIRKLYAVAGQAQYFKLEDVFTTGILIALAEREYSSVGWKPVITSITGHITPFEQTNYLKLCRTRAWDTLRLFEMVVGIRPGKYFEKDMTCLWNKTVRDKMVDVSLKPAKAQLIEKERKQVAVELQRYNFTGTRLGAAVDSLKENTGESDIIRNVIFASYRSGSTFVGEMVRSHPATFYEYEPLQYSGVTQVTTQAKGMEAINIFNNIFSCNYTKIPYWRRFAWKFEDRNILRRYTFCNGSSDICRDAKYLSNVCKLFPIQSMKTNRIQLKFARSLLENERLNVRIILLVRDPRAIMQSRGRDEVHDWCKLCPSCYDSKVVCENMWEDLMYADMFRREYPKRFIVLRYEDIALNPFSAAKKIFAFYGLQADSKVEKFLNTHSHTYQNDTFGTFRDSKNAVHHWKQDYYNGGDFTKVAAIQNNCRKMMKAWGYEAAENETDLIKRNLLMPPPWPEMLIEED